MLLLCLTLSLTNLPSTVQATAERWHLSDSPLLTLGGPDASGPTEFTNVYAGAFWAGRIAILDGATQTIRLFDPVSGKHIRTIGRHGQGPGEYLNAAYLQPLPGDSLFVSDIQQSRFTILEPNGDLARVVSVAALVRETRLTPVGRFADGSVLAWAPRFTDVSGTGLQRLPATLYRVDPKGTKADSLKVLPFATVQPMRIGGGGGWRAALGAGQMQPAVASQVAYLNSPTQFLVHVYQAATGTWTTISEPYKPRPGTEAMAKVSRDAAVKQGASPQLMAQVPFVDTLPAVRYPLLTASGRLWLVDGQADTVAHTRGLTAYGANGRREGRVLIPSGYQPVAISDSMIMLTEREESDGSLIVIYRLTPPRP